MVRIDIPDEDLRPDVIRSAIAGDVSHVPPSLALQLISNLDIPAAEQHTMLQEVLDNDGVDEGVRAAAVRVFMRLTGETGIPQLMKNLESNDQRVATAAASALGQVGTPEQLKALQKKRRGETVLRRRVEFAELLIVHRFGVADHEVDFPKFEKQPAALESGGLTFTTVKPGRDRRAKAIEGLKREFPSLDAAAQEVLEMQCGPRLMEIAFDRKFMGANGPGDRAQKPAMPAIVAFQDMEYGQFHPGLLVLSRATGPGKYRLMLTRLTGEPVYVGEGAGSKTDFEFEVTSVKAPGVAPVTARVRVSPKRAEISGVSERRAIPGNAPTKERE